MQQQTVKSVVLAGLSGGSGKAVVPVELIAAVTRSPLAGTIAASQYLSVKPSHAAEL